MKATEIIGDNVQGSTVIAGNIKSLEGKTSTLKSGKDIITNLFKHEKKEHATYMLYVALNTEEKGDNDWISAHIVFNKNENTDEVTGFVTVLNESRTYDFKILVTGNTVQISSSIKFFHTFKWVYTKLNVLS